MVPADAVVRRRRNCWRVTPPSLMQRSGCGPASELQGEFEGRQPRDKTGSQRRNSANERQRVSLGSGAGRGAPASEPAGEFEGRKPLDKD